MFILATTNVNWSFLYLFLVQIEYTVHKLLSYKKSSGDPSSKQNNLAKSNPFKIISRQEVNCQGTERGGGGVS